MRALTTSGQEGRQAPEISAQPALYPPEPLALRLTDKHLFFTSPFISTFYSMRRHVLHKAPLLSLVPAQSKQCLKVQRMGKSSKRNQSRPASLKEG